MVLGDMCIFVEGDDDKSLMERKLKYKIKNGDRRIIRILKWSKRPKDEINKLIHGCKHGSGSYLFLSDFDCSEFECKSGKKDQLVGIFTELERGNIYFIVRKIEGWYLAGISDKRARELGLNIPLKTDDIGKRKFSQIVSKKFNNDYAAKLEILNHFSIDSAKKKNSSFKYFYDRHLS